MNMINPKTTKCQTKQNNPRRPKRYNKTLPISIPIFSSLLLLVVLCFLPSTEASITLIGSGNKNYKTVQERKFGNLLSFGVEYVARLQFLGGDSICSDISSDSGGDGGGCDDDKTDINDLLCDIDSVAVLNKKLIIPHDRLPCKYIRLGDGFCREPMLLPFLFPTLFPHLCFSNITFPSSSFLSLSLWHSYLIYCSGITGIK